jgi:hypothetical protein
VRRPGLPVLAGATVAGFLALQLATGASLGSVRRELDEGRRSLAAAEADRDRAAAARADRAARARAAAEDLDRLRARLGALQLALGAGASPAVADLLADLEGTRADLAGANVRLWERSSEVGALRSCFVSVTRALSLVSLDQRAEALEVLGSAAPRCREAGAAR